METKENIMNMTMDYNYMAGTQYYIVTMNLASRVQEIIKDVNLRLNNEIKLEMEADDESEAE